MFNFPFTSIQDVPKTFRKDWMKFSKNVVFKKKISHIAKSYTPGKFWKNCLSEKAPGSIFFHMFLKSDISILKWYRK